MESSIGSVIAVDCGKAGYFQGKLAEVHIEGEKAITLEKAFKNGIPCGKSLRLEASSIVELKVLKTNDVTTAAVPPKPLPDPPNKTAVKENKKNKGVQRSKSMSSALKPSNQGNPEQKVNKPKNQKKANKPLESGCSSDDESSSPLSSAELRAKAKIAAKNRKHKGHHPLEELPPVTATPTPLFKRFEPQVPKPQQLSAPEWAIRSSKRGRGPCGIPILDVQNGYGLVRRKDPDLDVPIDFDLLATDFDFSSSLQDFDHDNIEPSDSAETQKVSLNFAHDENIISDPDRITSWTNVTSKNAYSSSESSEVLDLLSRTCSPVQTSFCPSGFEQLANGSRMPVLDKVIKVKFLKACRGLLQKDGYFVVIADRLLMIAQEILSKRSTPSDVVLISNDAFHRVALQMIFRFLDRGHSVTLFGLSDSGDSKIKFANSVKNLPKNPELVFLLHDGYDDEVAEWVKGATDVVALESRPKMDDYSKLHIVMLGTLTSELYAPSPAPLLLGRTSFAMLAGTAPVPTCKPDSRVADIGVPYSWIVDGGREALSEAFSLSRLAIL